MFLGKTDGGGLWYADVGGTWRDGDLAARRAMVRCGLGCALFERRMPLTKLV